MKIQTMALPNDKFLLILSECEDPVPNDVLDKMAERTGAAFVVANIESVETLPHRWLTDTDEGDAQETLEVLDDLGAFDKPLDLQLRENGYSPAGLKLNNGTSIGRAAEPQSLDDPALPHDIHVLTAHDVVVGGMGPVDREVPLGAKVDPVEMNRIAKNIAPAQSGDVLDDLWWGAANPAEEMQKIRNAMASQAWDAEHQPADLVALTQSVKNWAGDMAVGLLGPNEGKVIPEQLEIPYEELKTGG